MSWNCTVSEQVGCGVVKPGTTCKAAVPKLASDMLRIDPAETPAAAATDFARACASASSAACEQGCDCSNCGEICKPSTPKVRVKPEFFAETDCWAETS